MPFAKAGTGGEAMLRITVDRQATQTLILEGRLAGDWVEELRKVLAGCRGSSCNSPIVINLTAVCGMDSAGRDLLTKAHADGARLQGSGLSARAFCEEIAGAQTSACANGNVQDPKLLL